MTAKEIVIINQTIANIAKRQNFKIYASRLKECRFSYKSWLQPWCAPWATTYCTTIGNTIYLAKNFFDHPYKERWLVHEAAHLMQWDKLGPVKMTAIYATPSGRKKLEQEAENMALLFDND